MGDNPGLTSLLAAVLLAACCLVDVDGRRGTAALMLLSLDGNSPLEEKHPHAAWFIRESGTGWPQPDRHRPRLLELTREAFQQLFGSSSPGGGRGNQASRRALRRSSCSKALAMRLISEGCAPAPLAMSRREAVALATSLMMVRP